MLPSERFIHFVLIDVFARYVIGFSLFFSWPRWPNDHKLLYKFGPVFLVGVTYYYAWNNEPVKILTHWSSKKTQFSHKLCAFRCLNSRPHLSSLLNSNIFSEKLLLFQKTTLLHRELFLAIFYIITPLTNFLHFHWFRARHMICLSFTRRRPCDSASVCRALVRRLSPGVQYPDVRYMTLHAAQ